MIFWKSWNWPSYSRACLRCWLYWHLVAETSSFTVEKRKSVSQYFELLMWRHIGTQHWSWSSASTDYGNSHVSGFKIQNALITSHFSQLKMNGPLWSMSWKYWGHFDIGPCGCPRGIQWHWITLSQCRMICSTIWMAWCELWNDSNNGHTSHFCTYPWSFPEVVIIYKVAQRNGYLSWGRDILHHPILKAFLKYVQNEYCDKHRHVPVKKLESLQTSKIMPPATASEYWQSSFNPYDVSSDDEEYLTPNNVAEMIPGRSNHAARLLTTARLYWTSPPEAPKYWGKNNPNLNDYHSNPMEISGTFRIPDITDWWWHQEDTHSKYDDLSNGACDKFSIIPHGVGVEGSSSLGWDVISWRQSKTTG